MKHIITFFIFLTIILELYSQSISNKLNINNSTTIVVQNSVNSPIFGLSIKGFTILKDKNSLVQVILKDMQNNEYLIQEFFYPLFSPGKHLFSGCEEIDLINGVYPKEILIVCINAEVHIDELNYFYNRESALMQNILSTETQQQNKLNMLNQNLKKEGFLWDAEINEFNNTYKKRKNINKYKGNSFGFEYYSKGIFSSQSASDIKTSTHKSSDLYVSEFDWRNRHGAVNVNSPYYDNNFDIYYSNGSQQEIPNGWITRIRCQFGNNGAPWDRCGNACFAYGVINAAEAKMNLYYNQHLDYTLSIQDALDCNPYSSPNYNCYTGGYPEYVLKYLQNYGVVNETCFPFINDTTNCIGKCSNPLQKVKIESFYKVNSSILDSVKSALIKYGPMSANFFYHTMCLVGYGKVVEGMTLDLNNSYGGQLVIDSTSPYIGQTYWILKNSRTTNDGHYGYVYAISSKSPGFNQIWGVYAMTGYIKDLINPNIKPLCRDEDNDGYYNWGIGPKPSTCPICSLEEPDGDDSNPYRGPMDEYGHLQAITPYIYPTLVISTSQTWSTSKQLCGDLIVQSNATLTVTSTLTIPKNSKITVQNGGKLVVNGGLIKNANITVNSGSSLVLQNNAILERASNDEITINTGAVFDCTYGEIR